MATYTDVYDCLTKSCNHGANAFPTECGVALLASVIERTGDPKLLLEIDMICKIFRVCPLQSIFPYGVVDTSEQMSKFITLHDYLTKIHPQLGDCCDNNIDFFANKTPDQVVATTKAFECMLRSMGMRYENGAIAEDDATNDYGYTPGAAVLWRRNTWGAGQIDPRNLTDTAATATRAVMIIVLGMASIGRADLALELMTQLVNQRHRAGPTVIPIVGNLRSTLKADKAKICTACFADAKTAPIFARVMMSARSIVIKSGARSVSMPLRCRCGLSELRLRVVSETAPAAPVEIVTCPFYVISGLTQGCTTWVPQ